MLAAINMLVVFTIRCFCFTIATAKMIVPKIIMTPVQTGKKPILMTAMPNRINPSRLIIPGTLYIGCA